MRFSPSPLLNFPLGLLSLAHCLSPLQVWTHWPSHRPPPRPPLFALGQQSFWPTHWFGVWSENSHAALAFVDFRFPCIRLFCPSFLVWFSFSRNFLCCCCFFICYLFRLLAKVGVASSNLPMHSLSRRQLYSFPLAPLRYSTFFTFRYFVINFLLCLIFIALLFLLLFQLALQHQLIPFWQIYSNCK